MENGLDNLLVPSLRKTIEENLGKKTLNKIEQRLIERHGMNLVQAIKEFSKFDSVLREFFGPGADGLESKFLENIVTLEKTAQTDSEWFSIRDTQLSKMFLESLGDPDKNAIMNSVIDHPLIVSDILNACKIPQTSGYRKINALIKNGLLIPSGFDVTKDGKKVTKYETLHNNIKIDVEKNNVGIKIQIKKQSVEHSSIFQTIKI